MSPQRLFSDPVRFLDQIDRLHVKYEERALLYDTTQDGVSFASLSLNRTRVARLLADTVGSGSYELRPARTRWLQDSGKPRLVYVFCCTDLIVHGVVASILNERMQPHLSPQLYSYRTGKQWWGAVADFARYVRRHVRAHRDPRARGLYVLRRDIHQYTDSIHVGDRSALWPQISAALGLDRSGNSLHGKYWSLVRQIVRPERFAEKGRLCCNIRGIPTGSPITAPVYNLHLLELDDELTAIPGSFYARYCDDILFAHPDPQLARAVDRRIDEILSHLGLSTNADKNKTLYFTGAGRPSPVWETTRGTTVVPFLGCSVAFDSTVSLNQRKVRRLLKGLDLRARRTLNAFEHRTPEAAGLAVCAAINEALHPGSSFHDQSAPLLNRVVTSRRQLKELDYQIARIVIRSLTGDPGVRAFRQLPYRKLRADWGLVSLVHTRNTASRRSKRVRCGH